MASKKRGGIIGATAALVAAISAVVSIFVAHPKPGLKEIPYTMKIRYQVTAVQSDKWGTARLIDGTMRVTRDRLARHQGGSYKIKPLGSKEWSALRNLDRTIARLHDLLRADDNGTIWVVRAGKDGFGQKLRKVDLNPAVWANTEGTFPVDVIVGTIRRWHPEIRIGGIYTCRTIAGSSTLSQHAYANAVDVFGSQEAMNELAHQFYSWAQKGYLPVSQILWQHKNLFTGNYVYDHTDHVHFSGDPLLSGGCRRP